MPAAASFSAAALQSTPLGHRDGSGGLGHGVFSLVQFHAGGDTDPLASLFGSNTRFASSAQFPFQVLGFAALLILLLMAATSHDFWLHLLTPRVWKCLHMAVYSAYGLLVAHVVLGVLQDETSPLLVGVLSAGFIALAGLHLAAGFQEFRRDTAVARLKSDGYVDAGDSPPFRISGAE